MLGKSIAELHDELRRVRPTVIIPLGSEALRAVTGKTSIDKWRGSILQSPFGKVVPTYHPTRIMFEYTKYSVFEHDLQRAIEESAFPEIRPLGNVFDISPSFSLVINFLDSLLSSPRPISFDIETSSNHIRCLGIADSSTHAVCIPFTSNNRPSATPSRISVGRLCGGELNSYWTELEEYEILKKLDLVFRDTRIHKRAQNGQFDCQILAKEFGFVVQGVEMDTMLGAYTMYCELPKGLDFLASLYTKIPYWSDYDASSDHELWTYNCWDCVSTYQISDILLKDLAERNLGNDFNSLTFYQNHVQPSQEVMTIIGQRGVKFDTKRRDELKIRLQGEFYILETKWKGLVGDVNPFSPKQLATLLYEKLALPSQRNRKTGNVTVDDEALEKLAGKYTKHSEIFSTLLDLRQRRKLISTYLEIPLGSDGRIRTSFNAVGTVTGRCNSSRTIWGEGSNLQNIPNRTETGRLIRQMFVADDDNHVLIKADLSQAEFRLVVWFAKIQWLIDKYYRGESYDIHRWLASKIYSKPESEISKAERSIAKNGVYGGNYRMQAKTAAATYHMSIPEATKVLDTHRLELPEIPAWWSEVERVVNTTRQLTNPLGRVRMVMDRLDDSTYRNCYSHCCQSTVADIIHRAAILSELILVDCKPVLQIHDELVFLCKKSALSESLVKIKNIMEYPLSIPGVKEPLIIPAEISYGPNWSETKIWVP